MDILKVPRDPTNPDPKVPFLASEHYDGGPFLTYPIRRGMPWMLPSNEMGSTSLSQHEHLNPTPKAELDALLQTWLYFGLLYEVLGPSLSTGGVPTKAIDRVYDMFTTADGLNVISRKLITLDNEAGFDADFAERGKHLSDCLGLTMKVANSLGFNFDSPIKLSVIALVDHLGQRIETAWEKRYGDKKSSPRTYALNSQSRHVFSADVEKNMLESGWCPSDIESVKSKSHSVQTRYFLSQLNKTKPVRDHSRCNKHLCLSYQLSPEQYTIGHCVDGCSCSEIGVDDEKVVAILRKPGKIPVLKIHPANKVEDLEIEVLECNEGTPEYVAISHVWADGLGNPTRNSLHRCQVARLEGLLGRAALSWDWSPNCATILNLLERPLFIWIDTLCCPVGPISAKNLALEKITTVYKDAAIVIVLDASLQTYKSADLDATEIVARILTSSWMRRLWTLQEGILAQQERLYFQFADMSLSALWANEILRKASKTDTLHARISDELRRDLSDFIHFYPGHPRFDKLATALQRRSVSVASDEPLCIATLMSLPISKVLACEGQLPRMNIIWELISEKLDGIPSDVVFYEDLCLPFLGWRWAPQSLLYDKESQITADDKISRWQSLSEDSLGKPTPLGLKVRYPGFKLTPNPFDDGLPHSPWENIFSSFGIRTLFQDANGKWYQIMDSYRLQNMVTWTPQQRKEYDEKHDHAISRFIHGGSCFLMLQEFEDEYSGDSDDDINDDESNETQEGIIADGMLVKETQVSQPRSRKTKKGIAVQKGRYVNISTLLPPDKFVQENVRKLAHELRKEKMTRDFAVIEDKNCEAYSTLVKEIRFKMGTMMKEEYERNPRLKEALILTIGKERLKNAWGMIANWFENENTGTRVRNSKYTPNQTWYVD